MPEEIFDTIKKALAARARPRLWPPFDPDRAVAERLQHMNPQDLTSDIITRPEFATATVAGILLWADCLEESHRLSQEIPSTTGSFWHGIMHRREPDYANARYWFGRTGDHPAFASVYQRAKAALANAKTRAAGDIREQIATWGGWNPIAFTALVERARTSGDADEESALEIVQAEEMAVLLDWTYAQAISPRE